MDERHPMKNPKAVPMRVRTTAKAAFILTNGEVWFHKKLGWLIN
jgi:hypothetical protein